MLISQRIQAYCKTKGVRTSAKREMVADTLQKMNGRATAEEIWHELHISGKRVSSASVYSYLNWLIKKGFAERYTAGVREMMYVIKEQ